MTLYGKEHNQNRQADYQRGCCKNWPASAHFCCLQRVQSGCQCIILGTCHKGRCKEIFIPDINQNHNRRNQNTGARQRKNNARDKLDAACAVNFRRFLDFARYRIKVSFHVQQSKLSHRSCINQNQANFAVD